MNKFNENKVVNNVPVSDNGKKPPYALNVEKAILGAMMIDADALRVTLSKVKSSHIFYIPAHQKIYSCIKGLSDESNIEMDVITVMSKLSNDGTLAYVGGEEYLLELAGSIPSAANIEKWCEIVCQLYTLRKMISVCSTTIEKCYSAEVDKIDSIMQEIETSIFDVRDETTSMEADVVGDQIVSAVKYFEDLLNKKSEATGIGTGLPSVDDLIIGLRNQEMVVIAARPSIGKTSLALNIASNVAVDKGKKVGFFSLEMSTEQLTRRLMCSLAKISERDFHEGRFGTQSEMQQAWQKITSSASMLKKTDLYIDPTPGISISELRAKALRMKMRHDIDIIFIDYLQLMKADVGRNDNRQVEVAKISVGLKGLAKELDIPVVVLAQLNRASEQQERPKLSHLRESGAIEQDADIVMFLHRDRDAQKEKDVESVDAELIVEKNRNGQTGIANLLFFPKYTTFVSKSRYQEEY